MRKRRKINLSQAYLLNPRNRMHATLDVLPTQTEKQAAAAFARDVLKGLSRNPKSIPARYFYDDCGSKLFQQITELVEYYPTRCEGEILCRHKEEITQLAADRPFQLIELGPGDGTKTETLLREFIGRDLPFSYAPIDISSQALRELTQSLRRRLGDSSLAVHGIVAEYFDALALLKAHRAERKVALFLGSNIGNLDPCETRQFLANLRHALARDDLAIIGFDLKKDLEVLRLAYNDPQGVTARFNLNLLDRINRELGGNFDRDRFIHYGPYNAGRGRMESWLLSTDSQEVTVEAVGRTFTFAPWEGIHTESSYKYDIPQIEAMAAEGGFRIERHLFDSKRYFVDSIWRAV